jgi:DNA-binding beta-propeller fold protein YncE
MNVLQIRPARAGLALLAALAFAPALVACQPNGAPAGTATPGAAGTPGAPGTPGTPGAGGAVTPTLAASAREATARAAAMRPTYERTIGVMGIDPGQLQLPVDVAVDDAGNTYVSDSKGVQAFGPDGAFLRAVGAPDLKSAEGLAVTPDGGKLYVTGNGPEVQVYGPDGTLSGTLGEGGLTAGTLQKPVDVTLDGAGNVYVADVANAHVEKYGPDGRHLLTIGEKGQQKGQFTAPRSVAVDSAGRIYVGLGDDFLIQRFAPDGSYLDAFGQSYAEESMWQIAGLALDPADNVYASQAISHVVQSFDTSAARPRLRWELGEVGNADGEFRSPHGLAVHDGRLYVADRDNGRVQVFVLR